MGARNSKRSVDISGSNKDTDDTQQLEGKLEKIEEGSRVAVNGASHSEPKISQLEEQVSNGDPISVPEPVTVAEVAGPSSPTEEVQLETAEAEVIQPPKKKEKVKKKWSFRSISFSKKDKSKPLKDENTKDDADAVPEVAEEKTEATPSFMSSVTEAIGGASEAVSDAVISAEHKVEEGLTATQDQVEKISAKVAEKAEALVVKMEAMTVKAVDSVQEMIGLGEAAKADADKAEVALTEAVTNITLPEVSVESTLPEVTTIKVSLPEVAKSESVLPEVPKIDSMLPNSAKIDSAEGVTNIVLPEVTKVDSTLQETVTANVELAESVTCDIELPKAVPKDVVIPTPTPLSDEVRISADQELEALSQVKIAVTKGDEMPPPLPASPPPSSVIAEIVSEVVDSAVELGQTKDVDQLIEKVEAAIPAVSKPISPTTTHVPMVFSEGALTEGCSGGGGGDEAPPHVPSEVHFTMSIQSARHSDASLEGEVLTQVIEPVDSSVTSFDLAEDENENEEEEIEQESQDESVKNASETSLTSEDPTGPATKKTSEE